MTIVIPVPPGTRGKGCDVEIGTKFLRAGVKGQEAVLNGALEKEIIVDECYWNCDGSVLEITLQKKDGMHWWSTTVEGEPEVNTKKVGLRLPAPVSSQLQKDVRRNSPKPHPLDRVNNVKMGALLARRGGGGGGTSSHMRCNTCFAIKPICS